MNKELLLLRIFISFEACAPELHLPPLGGARGIMPFNFGSLQGVFFFFFFLSVHCFLNFEWYCLNDLYLFFHSVCLVLQVRHPFALD